MHNLTGKIYYDIKEKLRILDILQLYEIPKAWMKVNDDYIEVTTYEHDSSFDLDHVGDCITDLLPYVTIPSNLTLTDEYDNFIEYWEMANNSEDVLKLEIENESNLLRDKLEKLKNICSESENKINYIDIVQKLLLEIE